MIVGGRFCIELGRPVQRMLQMLDGACQFEQKLLSHFAREAVTDQDALNHEVFAVGRHGIRRNQPATLAQPIRYIIERERETMRGLSASSKGPGMPPIPS